MQSAINLLLINAMLPLTSLLCQQAVRSANIDAAAFCVLQSIKWRQES